MQLDRKQKKRMGLADGIDKDGRRKIIEKDEKIEMKLDTLIYAIGQKTKINEYFKEEDIDRFTLKIKDRKIFVGGDFYRGPSSIIDSIGDGKRAAFSILNFLIGREFEYYWIKDVKKQAIEFEENKEIKHQNPEYINLKERLNTFKEVEKTYTIRKAIKEAKRCLKCHLEK